MPKPEDEQGQIEAETEDQVDGQGQDQEQEEAFDKERALKTIRDQRESEKRLAKELKAAQARLKELDEADKKRQDAEKSELQKAQERAAQLEKALQEEHEATQALRLRQEFTKVARRLEFRFADVQAEEDAFLLADLEGVEMDADGKVTGLEDAVKALQKSRPYLFSQGKEGDGQGTPQRSNGKNSGKLNQDAVKGIRVKF